MNTKFEDTTPLPEPPVFKEMSEDELKKDDKKFTDFATNVLSGINDALEEDKD